MKIIFCVKKLFSFIIVYMSGYYRATGEGRKRKVARAVKAVGHRIVNAIAHKIASSGEGRRKRVYHRKRRIAF